MADQVLILTTAGNESEARKIAGELVERKLAACVNMVPRIHSIYRWQGRVETAEEYLLLVKTEELRAKEVEAAVRELHSYDLPELVVVRIAGGSEAYLNWISQSVR
ncbi:MAG: divalent-cation tolerance protein CutA [Acidobacteria bacterium]|nr:divalent-cation tolerance protein CutA [Acidobacteriota bacterium]